MIPGATLLTLLALLAPWPGLVAAQSGEQVKVSFEFFTIVQDGGESTLLVASQVPVSHVAFYHLTGAGHVVGGVQFRDVGTALKVGATVLAGNMIKIRLGATTRTHELTRRILGYRAGSSVSETLMALTATVR